MSTSLKPLTWEARGRYRFVAESPVGTYLVEQELGGDGWRWELVGKYIASEFSGTVEEAQAAAFENLKALILPALMDDATPTHRHVKRGSTYVLIGFGKMQAEGWAEHVDIKGKALGRWNSVDMREVAIYRSVDDGSLWARPREEFEDGRFEELK